MLQLITPLCPAGKVNHPCSVYPRCICYLPGSHLAVLAIRSPVVYSNTCVHVSLLYLWPQSAGDVGDLDMPKRSYGVLSFWEKVEVH